MNAIKKFNKRITTNSHEFQLINGSGGVKFIPIHCILHSNNFELNHFYHIVASVVSGTVTVKKDSENDYQGYDIECISHNTLIDANDNLKNIHINTDNSIILLSPETGSLHKFFSKYYFLVSDNMINNISVLIKKLQ